MSNSSEVNHGFSKEPSLSVVSLLKSLPKRYLIAWTGMLSLIFVGDMFVPLEVAFGVIYVLLVICTLWAPRWELTLVVALAASFLTLAGLVFSPSGSSMTLMFTNRILSLIAIWVTAFACIKQKKSEQEIEHSASMLESIKEKQKHYEIHKTILENVVDAIITITSEGTVHAFNLAGEKMFGYKAEEVLGQNIKMLMPSPYRDEHDDYLARYMATGITKIIGSGREVTGQRKDGTTFPIHLSVSQVVIEDQDQGVLFTGIIRDLTTQVQQRKINADYEGQINAISKSQMVIEFQMDGTIIKANDKFLETMGYSADELSGKHHSFFVEPRERSSEGYKIFWEKLNQGEYVSAELKRVGKNGKDVWLQASYNPILDLNGNPCKVVKYSVDITQRILSERALVDAKLELTKAKDAAELANATKSEFLANMSHEIRTPMTAILGFTDVLLGNVVNPENLESVKTIKRNGESLIGLINDILDLSKIEAGKLDVEMIDCSVLQVINEVYSLMKVRANAKGLQLEVRFDSAIPETICSDPTRLRQVLINIVGNAIKFTETESVQIITRLEKEAGSEPKLRIDVRDNGIGIDEENLKNLFLPFTQADGSTTRKFGGTGLGLTISRRLVELLGGSISVSSTLGEGSVFSVTVSTGPLNHVAMIECHGESKCIKTVLNEVEESADPLKNCRILFAEDGPDNQRLISFILKKAGAEVTLANNGQVGVDLASAALNEGRPFDVILMDMQMPVLDGYAATQTLRNLGYQKPIIALTAHAMSTDRQKCLDAGCDDYASKPIDRKQLIEMIVSYTKNKTVIRETMASVTSHEGEAPVENSSAQNMLKAKIFQQVSPHPKCLSQS